MDNKKYLKDKYDGMFQIYLDEVKSDLKLETQKLLEKYPEIEHISWNQYSAYNDGDATEFEISTDDATITGVDDAKVSKAVQKEILYVLSMFPHVALEALYGHEVTVVIDRKGIHTSDYENY